MVLVERQGECYVVVVRDACGCCKAQQVCCSKGCLAACVLHTKLPTFFVFNCPTDAKLAMWTCSSSTLIEFVASKTPHSARTTKKSLRAYANPQKRRSL